MEVGVRQRERGETERGRESGGGRGGDGERGKESERAIGLSQP